MYIIHDCVLHEAGIKSLHMLHELKRRELLEDRG